MGTVDGSAGLHRRLGLWSAAAVVVGEVIGVGIFLTPAGMARSLGSPVWLQGVWLLMGGMALAGALCFGTLAARFPSAGGAYVYLREAYGPRPAFLYGWTSLLVTDPGLTALFAVGMAEAATVPIGVGAWGVKGIAVTAILGLAAVNALGVGLGAGLMRWLTAVKIGLLVLIAGWGILLGRGDWSNLLPLVARRPGADPLSAALPGAFVAAFFSFGGWWDTSKLAGEVRDPERTLPRALALGVGVVTAVYSLISLVFFYLVPTERITPERGFSQLAGEALFGPWGGSVFAAVVAVVVLGCLAAIIMAAPRVYYAMARDGLFPHALAALSPRFDTPARAIALQATLASALVLSGTFEQILAYFFFVTVAFLALAAAAVFAPAVRGRAGDGLPRVPGHPFTPLAFLLPTLVLLALLAADKPRESLLGLAVVAIGLPAYGVAQRFGTLRRVDGAAVPSSADV
ncbi:MAG: APC family permease [Isosphaeraceae bacterium]